MPFITRLTRTLTLPKGTELSGFIIHCEEVCFIEAFGKTADKPWSAAGPSAK